MRRDNASFQLLVTLTMMNIPIRGIRSSFSAVGSATAPWRRGTYTFWTLVNLHTCFFREKSLFITSTGLGFAYNGSSSYGIAGSITGWRGGSTYIQGSGGVNNVMIAIPVLVNKIGPRKKHGVRKTSK